MQGDLRERPVAREFFAELAVVKVDRLKPVCGEQRREDHAVHRGRLAGSSDAGDHGVQDLVERDMKQRTFCHGPPEVEVVALKLRCVETEHLRERLAAGQLDVDAVDLADLPFEVRVEMTADGRQCLLPLAKIGSTAEVPELVDVLAEQIGVEHQLGMVVILGHDTKECAQSDQPTVLRQERVVRMWPLVVVLAVGDKQARGFPNDGAEFVVAVDVAVDQAVGAIRVIAVVLRIFKRGDAVALALFSGGQGLAMSLFHFPGAVAKGGQLGLELFFFGGQPCEMGGHQPISRNVLRLR